MVVVAFLLSASFASAMHSSIGKVTAGSTFAWLQSLGATGVAGGLECVGVGAAAGVAVGTVIKGAPKVGSKVRAWFSERRSKEA